MLWKRKEYNLMADVVKMIISFKGMFLCHVRVGLAFDDAD